MLARVVCAMCSTNVGIMIGMLLHAHCSMAYAEALLMRVFGQVTRLWECATWAFGQALQQGEAAIAMASSTHASQTAVSSCTLSPKGL